MASRPSSRPSRPRIRSKDDIRAFVRERASKRKGDYAFLFERDHLIIGTSNMVGEWWLFDCHPGKPEYGYELPAAKVRKEAR